MDIKSNNAAPVLTDPVPIAKSSFGILSGFLPCAAPTGTSFSSALYSNTLRKKPIITKLSDIRASGWLDSMKASSPPRKKTSTMPSPDGFSERDTYSAWTLKHPSALASFESITNSAKAKNVVLFLDYDGTLSPIVDEPDKAFMSKTMRAAVRNAAKYFPTAIISGRCRDKVYDFVGLKELYYAGSHGMDIMGPQVNGACDRECANCIRSTDAQGEEVTIFQPASDFLPMIDEVFRTLVKETEGIEGSTVENNKFCVSVHYRNVDERKWSTVGQIVHDILTEYPRLRLTHGRKVLEIRPVIDWDKGKAVEFLLEFLGLANSDDVLPIYVGDDRTDEDAFKVLHQHRNGLGILVSSVPKETCALYSLRDPSQVLEFLKSLVKWKAEMLSWH